MYPVIFFVIALILVGSLADKNFVGKIVIDSVGLGTAGLFPKTHDVVLSALNLGVRMIDSAQASEWYDETGVGTAVSEFLSSNSNVKKEDIVLLTKVHPRYFQRIPMDRRLKQSKENFRRNDLDVVLLHAPRCWPGHCSPEEEAVSWETGWQNLVALKEEQQIHSIGVSNFDLNLLKRAVNELDGQVDIIQNWMDPFHQDVEVRKFCTENGIQYMAYSSYGTQWNRYPNPVLTNPLLQEIANKYKVSVPQVIMAWLAAERVIAIPRTANVEHMKDNFAVYLQQQQQSTAKQCVDDNPEQQLCQSDSSSSGWELSPEEVAAIRGLDGTLGQPWD